MDTLHPNPFVMQFIAGTPVGVISDTQQIIEIKLWETYLLQDRSNLNFLLNKFSIDNGPIDSNHPEPGRILYRFLAKNWEADVKHLLYDNRIPVVIRHSFLLPLKSRGRVSVLMG
jgi:hypothetical protein